jgi:hypothetical protein
MGRAAKKADRAENLIVELLTLFADYHAGRGHPRQEPYKGWLFALCRRVYVRGHWRDNRRVCLSSRGVREAITGRWNGPQDQRFEALLDLVCASWAEWLYVMRRCRCHCGEV